MKLDIGCGQKVMEGYEGVDVRPGPNVKHVLDVREPWPWADESVEAIHSRHFVEHLTGMERVHFFDEAYRVLVPGGTLTVITPHWANYRAYGDPTHQWPPVSEYTYTYLRAAWRTQNAPHVPYNCDFLVDLQMLFLPGTEENHIVRATHSTNVCHDLLATLTKRANWEG